MRAPITGDDRLGLAFIPLGNATPDYVSGHRTAAMNQYTDALVALDAETGTLRWSFQTTHRDVWDYDNASPPTLADFPTAKGPEHRRHQPFGQVPTYRDDELDIFESGAISMRIAERGTHEGLLARRGIYAAMWDRQHQVDEAEATLRRALEEDGVRPDDRERAALLEGWDRVAGE